MAKKPKYYVVWKGRQTGIFTSWEECSAQVSGYPDAQYKTIYDREAAEQALRGKYEDYTGRRVDSGESAIGPICCDCERKTVCPSERG